MHISSSLSVHTATRTCVPRVVSLSHKFRPCFIFSPFLSSYPPFFHHQLCRSRFISFRFILFHLISFYIARAREHPALRRANTRGKWRFLVFMFIFFLFFFFWYDAFIWRLPSETRRDGGRKEKTRWGTLGFIPVVNNIFIAASSGEKRGVQKCISGKCLPFLYTPVPTEPLRKRNTFRLTARSSQDEADL